MNPGFLLLTLNMYLPSWNSGIGDINKLTLAVKISG